MHRNRISGGWLLAALLLGGCASMKAHLPFGKSRAPVPQPVSELEVKPGESAPPVLQFWERNTLVVDLRNVPATGRVILTRRSDRSWPARISLRMAPGRFEVVEVRGAQRIVLPVAAGSGAVTAALPPGIYGQESTAITVSWGEKGDF